MVEIISFIQKYVPAEALIPLFFLIIILFYKYVYTPWDTRIKKMEKYLNGINDKIENNDLAAINNQLAAINNTLENLMNCKSQCAAHDIEIKKILEKLNTIEKKVSDIVERLEKAKDETKDNKIDFNQQLFSIKQEISDLRSKIEPLLFIKHGIK